jgi:hypothetical protein
MKLKTLLTISVIGAAVSAVVAMLFPEPWYALFGVSTDAIGIMTARYMGAAVAGYIPIVWLVRDAGPETQKPVLWGLVVTEGLMAVVSVIGLFAGIGVSSWIGVIVFGLFALIYAYYLMKL